MAIEELLSPPCLRAHISRFGAYATDDLHRQPGPFDPLLSIPS
ncbi:hypothetical protein [Nonomuraea sp. NPDC005501]